MPFGPANGATLYVSARTHVRIQTDQCFICCNSVRQRICLLNYQSKAFVCMGLDDLRVIPPFDRHLAADWPPSMEVSKMRSRPSTKSASSLIGISKNIQACLFAQHGRCGCGSSTLCCGAGTDRLSLENVSDASHHSNDLVFA
jgi:hypothetical protein